MAVSIVNYDTDTPNTKIVYPDVPAREVDPRGRINAMIKIFNHDLRSNRPFDRGFFHEIVTAKHLVQEHKINHGKQISRPLTQAERESGLHRGHSQMVTVPMEDKKFRELDMVYTDEEGLHIVEAKNTHSVDTHQLQANVELVAALRDGSSVVYALAGQKEGQERALRAAYAKLHRDFRYLVELEFVNITERICDLKKDILRQGRYAPLPKIVMRNLQEDFNLRTVDSEFDVYDNYSDISGDESQDDTPLDEQFLRMVAAMSGRTAK